MPRIHGVERRATPDLNRHESRGHVGNRAARDDEACTNSATGLILLPACVGGAPGHGPVSPSSRLFVSASAAFDGDRGDLVILALVETPSGPTNETWTWKGMWSQHHPTHSPAPPRSAILVDDPADHAVLLYGRGSSEVRRRARLAPDRRELD
jgi:hypothetical protein